jgi:holo-[acyl-carrier protein] synthase
VERTAQQDRMRVPRMTAGTDIVSVARVQRLIERGGPLFLDRWFTADEIAYCSRMAHPALHFAARLAAKEAVVKSLGGPGDDPVPWRSIEVCRDDSGAPSVRLSGRVRESADALGVREISVSLSHCQEFATAMAVAARTD